MSPIALPQVASFLDSRMEIDPYTLRSLRGSPLHFGFHVQVVSYLPGVAPLSVSYSINKRRCCSELEIAIVKP